MTLIIQKPTGAKLNLAQTYVGIDDPDAAVYVAAVEAADGEALETATKVAIHSFVKGCKNDGIWPAIKASCILAGARTLAGALVPLVGTAPTNVGPFVSGDYNRKTGLVGDGSTKYLGSNRNYNQFAQNDGHMSVYATTLSRVNNKVLIGGYEPGGVAIDGVNRISFHLNSPAFVNGVTTAGSTAGLYGVSRSSSANVSRRYFGISDSQSTTSTTPVDQQIGIFVYQPITFGHSSSRLAFYSIGESLNLALLDARVTTLINAFAAAIP